MNITTNNSINHYFRLFCLYLIYTSFFSFTFFAQQEKTFDIQWKNPIEYVDSETGITKTVPNFDFQIFAEASIFYQVKEETSANANSSFELTNYQTAPANAKEINYLKSESIVIGTSPYFSGATTNGGGKRYQIISIVPFVKVNNVIHRITSFTVKQTKLSPLSPNKTKSFATESVLKPGSGKWYKIAVNQDGIYKISKQFLTNLGIDVANLNPQHIHIYGNGDGLLPVLNSAPRTDDLAQNAIYIAGESDGVFNDGDYILFYAKGPHRWDVNSAGTGFVNERHIYSDLSYYFININEAVAPKRIQNLASTTLPITHTVTSYSFRAVHETDLVNLAKSGQRWYGETFDVELTRTFNFSVPNPVLNAPSTAIISMGAKNNSSSNANLIYTINGTQLLDTPAMANPSHPARNTENFSFLNNNSNVSVKIELQRFNPSTVAYLDKIEINTRRLLTFYGSQFSFRDLASAGGSNVCDFQLSNLPANGFVWDVSDKNNPQQIQGQSAGSIYSFQLPQSTLREFVASNGSDFFEPTFVEQVNNQNLHALSQVDYLIITPSEFVSQANRLADLHRNLDGLSVHVVELHQIYNEFSSGAQDAGAIRRFVKMFYDRSTSPADQIKYVCLFGDGTYDPKNRIAGNNNHVPTYQLNGSNYSETDQLNIVADDFYAMLDDGESMNSASLPDVGIGRLLVNDLQTGKEIVNKIEHYMRGKSDFYTTNNVNCVDGVSSNSFGDWRIKAINIADMEDYFFNDQEGVYNYTKANHPEINTNKLYLDAFQLESTVAGTRSPALNSELTSGFNSGTLIINYVGHGSEYQLSESRIVTVASINELRNSDRLPVFVSATCEFTRFDNPALVSAGELMQLNPLGGAVALMTTTRTVVYSINSLIVSTFYKNVFKRKADHSPSTLGEIMMRTKIETPSASTDKNAFTLIGDPALKINLPRFKIVIDSVNGKNPQLVTDTIKALSKVKVHAHIEDGNGNVMTSFNGTATPSLYDKPQQLKTLGHRPGPNYTNANVKDFELQKNVIYRGQSTVTNGHFSFEFIVPKDINYNYGNGKFSLYADNQSIDASGEEQRVIVGGVNPQGLADDIGPTIKLYLNHPNFANGGTTDETPFLIAKIKDENGINTVGNGIGHDITAVLDGKTNAPIVLNNFFKNDLDSYQSGELRYQFSRLEPGRHTLTLKVWDVNNNSSEETIEFIVQEKKELALTHVLNYPNPFTTSTQFFFEHNQCCTELETQVQIFTISGRLVKTINTSMYTQGYRSEGIQWDGKDEFGDELARGVYIYRLKVKTPDGETAEKLEKLVLL
jgi:hypothetical protein